MDLHSSHPPCVIPYDSDVSKSVLKTVHIYLYAHSRLSQILVKRKSKEEEEALNVTYTHWSMDHFHLEELFIPFPPLVGNESKQSIYSCSLSILLRSTYIKSLKPKGL